MTIYIILGLIIILAVLVIVYNNLVIKSNNVYSSWAQTDLNMKKRFFLALDLAKIIMEYADQEKSTYDKISEIRGRYLNTMDPEEALMINQELTRVLIGLNLTAEQYAELKENPDFLKLNQELSNNAKDTEQSKQYYNDMVMKYNKSLQAFPNSILAGMLGFKGRSPLQIDGGLTQNATM